MVYSISKMYHSTQLVADLPETKAWFERVFRRKAGEWKDRWDLSQISGDYPPNYSYLFEIRDVVHDTLCPTLYAPPGTQNTLWGEDIRHGLCGISWWIHDSRGFTAAMAQHGVRLRDQAGKPVEPGAFGESLITPYFSLMTADPQDVGFDHTFSELLSPPLDRYVQAIRRLAPGAALPPVDRDDPLGIDRSAYHTLETHDLARSLKFLVNVLGGKVIAEQPSQAAAGHSTFVHFADTVLEMRVPQRPGAGLDTYTGITFKVADLAAAKRHLKAQGVGLSFEDGTLIITEAKDSLGMTWGFTSRYVPDDPRARGG